MRNPASKPTLDGSSEKNAAPNAVCESIGAQASSSSARVPTCRCTPRIWSPLQGIAGALALGEPQSVCRARADASSGASFAA
ncbi:MAG: hypothetical protein CMJ88_00505 [Planctomycetes bacterium]|nr:hypothetical protein [Planctomycetota bacterium]